jgi:hypothetical protein
MWLDWVRPYVAYYTQVDEMIDLGDSVVVLVRDHAKLSDTDYAVPLMAGSIWQLRDGRIVRVQFFRTQEHALKAAGLSD